MLNTRILTLCAWSGPATVVIALGGWLIAGVLPLPLGASSSVDQVVNFYSHDTRVLAGLAISSVGICLVFPLTALIGVFMVRMEGRTPVLTFLQLVSGAAANLMLFLPMLLMAFVAFRPDRNPELTVTLNDLAWLLFLTPIAPIMIQEIAIGVAILNDKRQTLPRWVAFVNFGVAFSFIPDPLAFFFHSGPFAWNGIFIFWLATTTYAIWLLVMGVTLRNAIQELADADVPSVATTAA